MQHLLTVSENKIYIRILVLPEFTLLTHPLGSGWILREAQSIGLKFCLREKHICSDINSPKIKGDLEKKERLQGVSSYDKNFYGIFTENVARKRKKILSFSSLYTGLYTSVVTLICLLFKS